MSSDATPGYSPRSEGPSVVVIGAGVAGLSAALPLARLGARVTVLERGHLAAGSTALSAGVFSVNQVDQLMTSVRMRSRRLLDELEAEHGMHVSRQGYLRLATRPEHVDLFREALSYQAGAEAERSRLLGAEEIADLVPDLAVDDVLGAMWNPRDGHLDGPLLCGLLAELGRELGVQIHTRSEVVEARRIAGGRHALVALGERFECDVVVNAAGPWAERVGDLLGAPLPLVNLRHETVIAKLPMPLPYVMPMVQEYVPGDAIGVYFRQEGPDTLLCGLHTHDLISETSEDPDEPSPSVSWDAMVPVAQRVDRRLDLADIGYREGWAGLYPTSPDKDYMVGPSASDASVFALAGLSGSGLGSAPALGEALAEWVMFGEPRTLPQVRAFVPSRPALLTASARHD